MITLRELDDHITYQEQLAQQAAPIVLVNAFHVAPGDGAALVKAWADDAAYMKGQPGYIATQLLRGIAGSGSFVNIATWESAVALRDAFSAPGFQATLTRYPLSTVASPHVFQKVAVPGICLG